MSRPPRTPAAETWTLERFEERPELRRAADAPGRGVRADWSELRTPGGASALRGQPLGRAVGAEIRSAVDATAGLGFDAWALALMGIEVLAWERHASVFALLQDALRRARLDPGMSDAAARIRVERADALERLRALERKPDLVLLDPMYGGERGAAKPSKAMQALAAVAGADADADLLLPLAIAAATRRVVVKRARLAPPLAGREPDWCVRGKVLRFDVYRGGA